MFLYLMKDPPPIKRVKKEYMNDRTEPAAPIYRYNGPNRINMPVY